MAGHLQSVNFIGQIEIALHVRGCAINLQNLAPNVSNTWITFSGINQKKLEPKFFQIIELISKTETTLH